jgi:hydroxyacylglutathione hydrolase
MKRVNADGPKLLAGIPGGEAIPAHAFHDAVRKDDAVVIDLRRPEAFGGAHIPNSLNIGAGLNLSMWAGWVVPYDRPILLAGDESTDIEGARRSLIRVGFDEIRGYLKDGVRSWIEAGFEQEHIPQESVQELADKLPERPFILDVRSDAEWKSGHIAGAMHIPGGELPKRTADVPSDSAIHVICGSGYRSSIAASILARSGRRNIINVVGGMAAWNARKFPTQAGSGALHE